MAEAILAMGGNQGAYPLAYALAELKRVGEVRALSSLVKGPALPVPGWGENTADFLNLSLVLRTELSLSQLIEKIHEFESAQFRRRDLPEICTLDIDVLRYEGVWQRPYELHRPYIRLALHELLGMSAEGIDWPQVHVCAANEVESWLYSQPCGAN